MLDKEKSNERTCIVCKKKSSKCNLLRFVLGNDGRVFFDMNQKMNGRGGYIHLSLECLEKYDLKYMERVFRKTFKVKENEKIHFFDAFSNVKKFLNYTK